MSQQERRSLWQRVRRMFTGERADRPATGRDAGEREIGERNGGERASDDRAPRKQATNGSKTAPTEKEAPDDKPAAEEQAPPPAAANGTAKQPASSSEHSADTFSALDLRDRVTLMLLFDQVVQIDQVEAAWHYWRDDDVDTPDTLWRVIARLPGVDREAVYAQAARAYAFDPVDFNMYGARALLRKRRRTFTRDQWKRLVHLNMAPVLTVYDEEKDDMRWTFATHDPARPAVQRLLATLDVPAYELRYAPQEPIEEVFEAAFPRLARERTKPPSLPPVKERGSSQKGGPQSDSAPGAARQSTRKRPGGAGGEMDSRQAAAGSLGDQRRAPGKSESAPTLAVLFDAVLIGIVQTGARQAYLLDDAQGRLAIYHRQRRNIQLWRTQAGISAEEMIDYVSGRVLSLRPAEAEEAVERWVAGRPLAFRLSITPARDLPEEVPAAKETEVGVIEVIR